MTLDPLNISAILVGSISLLMGFVLTIRRVGSPDGEGVIKFLGIFELRTSRVGPGVIFAVIGACLISFGLWMGQKSAQSNTSGQNGSNVGENSQNRNLNNSSNSVEVRVDKYRAGTNEIAEEVGILRRTLTETAMGHCPADLMGPILQSACSQQQPNIGNSLRMRGAIGKITYVGPQIMPGGTQNVFRVSFESGEMTWMLSRSPDGKIFLLNTPNL